jgi:outer membrane protein assembly factor BamB
LTACRGTPARVICRDVASGRELWRSSLAFVPSWSAACDGLLLAAGDAGVAALRRADGSRLWTFTPPENRQEPLTRFRSVDGRLFFFHGDRFLAFDAASGEPLWQLRAPLAGLRPSPPAGRFVPYYFAGKSLVLLQSTDGLRLTLRADTGERLGDPVRVRPWSADPVACGDDVVTVEGDRRVVCLHLCGSGGWTHTVPGKTTLSGRPPRVAAVGDALLLLVETNIGYTLQRLDRATGKPLWPTPELLGEPVNDPADWAANGGAVCLVENGVLTCRSLAAGKRFRETPLGPPGRAWHVEALKEGVMAYPAAVTGSHFAFRWLTGRLQWTVTPDAAESIGRGFPVVCFDGAGRPKQRFDLAAGAPAFRAERGAAGGLAVVPLVAAWRGRAAGCPPVQVSARGVVVAVGPHAWSLAPAAK